MGADEASPSGHPQLPPGFRFHPTDEELLIHYLKKKVSSSPLPVSIIADVDLYKFDPWDLPGLARFGEQEWYFFSPRDRKYPNGARPNRAAASGYWKATGTDKPVVISGTSNKVGVKKALVFYQGRPPKGIKTNWIMHEYRLTDSPCTPTASTSRRKGSLRLDDWVLCRIYKKMTHFQRTEGSEGEAEAFPNPPGAAQYSQQQLPLKFESFSGLLQGEERPSFLDMGLDLDTSDDNGGQPVFFSSKLDSLKRNLSLVFNDDDVYNSSPKRPNVSSPMSVSQSINSFHKAAAHMGSYTDLQQLYSLPFAENRLWSTETGQPWISYTS